jgi:hypothetical protein
VTVFLGVVFEVGAAFSGAFNEVLFAWANVGLFDITSCFTVSFDDATCIVPPDCRVDFLVFFVALSRAFSFFSWVLFPPPHSLANPLYKYG